jgi:methylisocitrate lyase
MQSGVGLILYPLSAFRAMSLAALKVYQTIVDKGTQEAMVDLMQTRNDLYDVLRYQDFEKKLDQLMERQDGQ